MRTSRLLVIILAVAAAWGAEDKARKGAAPAAADVSWDLRLPADPDPTDVAFVDGWIAKLPRLANDSSEMGDCIATLMTAENWPKAYPRLCRALANPEFKDLYGASEIVLELYRTDHKAEGRRLFGFIAKASERVTDPGDLDHFVLACLGVRDRKAVPRLIELLKSQDANLRGSATEAIVAITGMPAADAALPEKVQAWWNANWSRTPEAILADQLKSADPLVQADAAAGLCERREAAIFPVLFKLLRSTDPEVCRKAITVIQRATGRDWQYDPAAKPEERLARVELMEKWWREERLRFNWPGLPRDESPAAVAAANAAAGPVDPSIEDVANLGSDKQSEVQKAEAQLRSRREKAVPALLDGLDNTSLMVRRRSYEILKDAAKQNLPFDPRADAGARKPAVDAWRAWAVKAKLVAGDEPVGGEAAKDGADK